MNKSALVENDVWYAYWSKDGQMPYPLRYKFQGERLITNTIKVKVVNKKHRYDVSAGRLTDATNTVVGMLLETEDGHQFTVRNGRKIEMLWSEFELKTKAIRKEVETELREEQEFDAAVEEVTKRVAALFEGVVPKNFALCEGDFKDHDVIWDVPHDMLMTLLVDRSTALSEWK